MKALPIHLALLLAIPTAFAAPANDMFANAVVLSGAATVRTGNNFGATAEPGEPEHDDDIPARTSVWYRWTAPDSGMLTVSTAGSTFDTILAVYTGSQVSALTQLASNDEADDSNDSTSKLRLLVTAGVTYRIVVDGFFGDTGSIVLSLNLLTGITVPANDNFANGIVLTGSPASGSGNNYLATMEPGEFDSGGDGGHSVWWEWTAPTTGRFFVTTLGSDFDTVLSVTTDTVFIDWNDDDVGTESGIHFKAQAGVRYHFGVLGYGGATGEIRLEVRPDPAVKAPAWTLTDMNGQTLRLSDFAGKVVMLDFWATWCGPCVSEIPDFIAMQNEYGPDGFVIIGASTDENGFADVVPFVAANRVNYISTISTAQIERDYGPVSAIPTTYIIDRQGMIDQRLVGSRSRETFDAMLLPLIYPEMKLQVVRDGSSVVLSWPVGPSGYVLESCASTNPIDWITVSGLVTVSGANNTIRLPLDQSQRWFRLAKN